VDEIRVSLDGFQAENDALRGRGNYHAALRAIELLHGVGFEVKVLITLTSINSTSLPRLVEFLTARGIRRVNINPFRPFGRGATHPELAANISVARESIQSIGSRAVRRESDAPELYGRSSVNCGIGRFVNIMPDGDVYPCHVLTRKEFRCGSIRTESLRQI